MNPNEWERNFFIGGEWCYLKIYSGPKTADNVLADIVRPLTADWIDQGLIDKWFFIRYGDPKLHLRVRIHLPNPEKLGTILPQFHDACRSFLQHDLIAKIQADTYQREVERYGPETMSESETLFFHDSRMQVRSLEFLRGDQGEQPRWIFCLIAIDRFLADFDLDLEAREALLNRMRESYNREFGGGKGLKILLDNKFRSQKSLIGTYLGAGTWPEGDIWTALRPLLDERSAANRQLTDAIGQHLTAAGTPPRTDFLNSHIHMMVNRCFRTRQRAHELVLYDFLHRQYKSQLARRKYGK